MGPGLAGSHADLSSLPTLKRLSFQRQMGVGPWRRGGWAQTLPLPTHLPQRSELAAPVGPQGGVRWQGLCLELVNPGRVGTWMWVRAGMDLRTEKAPEVPP